MPRARIKKIIYWLSPLLAVCLFLGIWLIVAKIINAEIILPTPQATFAKMWALFQQPTFWHAIGNTLLRTLISFGISFIVAIILAIISNFSPTFYRFIQPIITILRATPTMSIILLAILWISSLASPMFIAGLISFPLLFASFYDGLQNIDGDLIKMSQIYKIPTATKLSNMYIPALLPAVFTALGSGIALNLKVIIASEVLAQTRDSMGLFMQQAKIYLDTSELLAWTVVAIVISFLLELVIKLIRKIVIRWEK